MSELLHQRYRALPHYTPFERHGHRYPVSVFYPQPEQDVPSILGQMLPQPELPDTFDFLVHDHLAKLRASGRTVFDGVTYAMTYITTAPTLQIHARLGSYFNMLMTCDALETEFRNNGSQTPLRDQQHHADVFTNATGRSAAIGGSTLIVFNKKGDYHALVGVRDSHNALEPGRWHVAPAFMFQPVTDDVVAEWDLPHQIMREYLEELFGMPENRPENYDFFHKHPEFHRVQSMLSDGRASLYLLGIVINLHTLRPDISTLLLIRDPAWFEAFEAEGQVKEFSDIIFCPINSDADILKKLPHPSRFTSQGGATFWLGVDLARQKIVSNP